MRFGRSWGQRARGVRGGLRQLRGADGHSEEPAGCQGVARRSLAGVGGGAQGGNSTTSVGPPLPPLPPAVVMCHTASHLWSQAGCRHRGWRAPRAARSLRHEAAPCSPDSPPWAGLVTLCLGVASQLSTCWGGDVPPEKRHTEARVSATGLGARTTLGILSTFELPPLLTAKTGTCETLM